MGSQIAALLANAGCRVDLLDLPDAESPQTSDLAAAGLTRALKARPPAFFVPELAARVRIGSLEDLSSLNEADWIIEAIVENLEAKRQLHARLDEAVGGVIPITTNTSGLSIERLSAGRSEGFRRHFLGVHFFNPPRYMKLVELIPGAETDAALTRRVSDFIEDTLGKRVVLCRDTPNFIANRLGVFALMDVLHRMERDGLTVEEADAVTGELIGRPKSATLRLCDIVGLDTLANVARTALDNLPDDDRRQTFELPGFVAAMVQAGLLGEKSGGGFYRKGDDGIQTLDLGSLEFRERKQVATGSELSEAAAIRDVGERLVALWQIDGQLARFARDHLTATLAYAVAHAEEIASDVAQIDRAMMLGFNWEAGPFELIDALGAERLRKQLEGSEDSSGEAVPELLRKVEATGASRFYAETDSGGAGAVRQAYSLQRGRHEPLAPLRDDAHLLLRGATRLRNDNAKLLEVEEGVGVLLFEGRLNVIGEPTLELVRQAVEEHPPELLVLYGSGVNFSAGANLKYVMGLIESGSWTELEGYVKAFQDATMAVRFAPFPVVAAPRGLALGGGCEFCLASAARVPAAELRMGLVESRVGLIPGAGGCKEMVRRNGADIEAAFQTLFEGRFSDNAHQARQRGLLGVDDAIQMNDARVLQVAIETGREMMAEGYQRPSEEPFLVAGQSVMEKIEESLEVDARAGRIPSHERVVGGCLARVLCAVGASDQGGRAHEQDLLDLEREVFLELCGMQATRQRIAHMLDTGKPLVN